MYAICLLFFPFGGGDGGGEFGGGECFLVCMRANYHFNSESASVNWLQQILANTDTEEKKRCEY